MFSKEERCRYGKNQLGEVICQLRFPEILSIEAEIPAKFQELIRAEFPKYTVRREADAPKLTGAPGSFTLQNQGQHNNYQFASLDGVWRVNLTSRSIWLACSRYDSWEQFAAKLDKPLAAFITTYNPACFERVGLRYMNFISRKQLGMEGTPFSELIRPCYLGILAEEDVAESAASRCTVDTELAIRGGCRVKLHAGPGMVKQNGKGDGEIKFIFDQDLYMQGNVPVNHSTGALQTLHSQAYSIFRGAITPLLHRAMEPEDI